MLITICDFKVFLLCYWCSLLLPGEAAANKSEARLDQSQSLIVYPKVFWEAESQHFLAARVIFRLHGTKKMRVILHFRLKRSEGEPTRGRGGGEGEILMYDSGMGRENGEGGEKRDE